MSETNFALVELKSGKIIVSPKNRVDERFAPAVAAVDAALHAVASDIPVAYYVAHKFKKFGDKEQVAVLLNALPGFADSGLDPKVAHIAINGERAALRADLPRLIDASAIIIGKHIDLQDGPGAHFDARFSWVPYASLIAVSHPAVNKLVTVHPVTRKSIPFPDRYVSMALKDMVNFKELSTGKWNRSELLEVVLTARQKHENRPLSFPTTLDVIREEALKSLADAQPQAAPAPAP